MMLIVSMNAIDYKFGRYIVQIFSSSSGRMLEAIYSAYVEPQKELPAAAQGIIDEVQSWPNLSAHAREILEKIELVKKT